MTEIVIHGRGGQGAVTAAKILAMAALADGKFAIYRPGLFAAERMGAPVKAFVRISDEEIYRRYKITSADGMIILDPSLLSLGAIDVLNGVKKGGWVVINSRNLGDYPDIMEGVASLHFSRATAIDATSLALKHGLGATIVNTAILGMFAAPPFSLVSLDALLRVVTTTVPRKTKENLAALQEVYEIGRERFRLGQSLNEERCRDEQG